MRCPHCNTHIDEHPANPCLNAWVATDVMDIKIIEIENCAKPKDAPVTKYWVRDDDGLLPPPYSKRIAPAWEVHEKACSWIFSKRREYFRQLRRIVSAREYPQGQISWPDVMIFLKPEDFCRAAIKTNGG